MVKYVCPRCYQEFKQKGHFQNHLNRKRPCKDINELINKPTEENVIIDDDNIISTNFPQTSTIITQISSENQCSYCKKNFSRSDSLKRHLKTCKKKKQYIAENKEIYEELYLKVLEKMQEHEDKIRRLEEENMLLKSNNGTAETIGNIGSVENQTVNNNSHNTTNNINIQINALGHENTDYLTTKDKVEIVEKMHKSILTYVEKIHFNPEHPENHNVYFQSLKNSYGAMFNGDRWETRHISDIVESLMDCGRNKIEEIKEELKKKGKMRSYVEGRLDELFNAIDGDDSEKSRNIMKVSEERIKFLAFDRRDVVKETMNQWFEDHKKSKKRKCIKI